MRRLFVGIVLSFWLAGCQAARQVPAPPQDGAGPLTTYGTNTAASRTPRARPSPPAARTGSRRRGWLSKEALSGNPVMYVAAGNEVLLYSLQGGSPIGVITDGVKEAYGLFVDTASNLYVCNQKGSSVTVYPPGQTTPSFTYSQGLSRPLYAAADANRLFVGNAGGGAIVEYALGNGQAQNTIQSLGTEVDGMDFDTAGNLYAAYRNGDGDASGGIEYFPQGSGTGQDLGIVLDAPQGVTFDSNNDLLVVETQATNRIDAFHLGQSEPYAETKPVRKSPTEIALDPPQQNLYASTLGNSVKRTVYPTLGKLEQFLRKGELRRVQGMAISPGTPGEGRRFERSRSSSLR